MKDKKLIEISDYFIQSKAEFYDSLKAIADKGVVNLRPDGVYFFSECNKNKTVIFPFRDIVSIEEFSNYVQIKLKEKSEVSPSFVLNIFDMTLLKSLRKRVTKSNPKLFSRILMRFNHLPLWSRILSLAVGLGLVLVVFLGLLPEAYVLIPLKNEKILGERIYEKIIRSWDICSHKKLTEILKRMEGKLRNRDDIFDYKITIIQSNIENAFALPGGHIIFFSKIISKSKTPDEIAAILAHEMEHIQNRHGLRQIIRLAGYSFIASIVIGGWGLEELEMIEMLAEIGTTIFLFKYSRDFETEADRLAIQRLNHKGISVRGFRDFFIRMQNEEQRLSDQATKRIFKKSGKKNKPGGESSEKKPAVDWWSAHPNHQARIKLIEGALKKENFKKISILKNNEDWNNIKAGCR